MERKDLNVLMLRRSRDIQLSWLAFWVGLVTLGCIVIAESVAPWTIVGATVATVAALFAFRTLRISASIGSDLQIRNLIRRLTLTFDDIAAVSSDWAQTPLTGANSFPRLVLETLDGTRLPVVASTGLRASTITEFVDELRSINPGIRIEFDTSVFDRRWRRQSDTGGTGS